MFSTDERQCHIVLRKTEQPSANHQPLIPMSPATKHPEITLSHRRGKIARLPRLVREQLNIRLDDAQEAAEILPWLNDLPEVRQFISRHFNGTPISPQNLSAWRQGGFHEWLLHRELLDSASHMREHVEEFQQALASESDDSLSQTLADSMVTQLSVRLAAFMAHWDGAEDNAQLGTLLKIGQFLVKLQQATYRAEREALELPALRRKAEDDQRASIGIADAYREYWAEMRRIHAPKPVVVPKAETTVNRKTPVPTSSAPAQSSLIKANQGSRPQSTQPVAPENVESGPASPGSNEPLVSSKK
jgi:hypothetical protein